MVWLASGSQYTQKHLKTHTCPIDSIQWQTCTLSMTAEPVGGITIVWVRAHLASSDEDLGSIAPEK